MKKSTRYIDGATFRRARKRFGLSQIQAGEILGVDETTIQRWESGQTKKVRRVSLDTLSERAPEYLKRKRGG